MLFGDNYELFTDNYEQTTGIDRLFYAFVLRKEV